eukprot:m.73762 g.73762  ORF g.73762 m.73762 type:complete len:285 (-) comp13050_c0_seq3:21-875(-)
MYPCPNGRNGADPSSFSLAAPYSSSHKRRRSQPAASPTAPAASTGRQSSEVLVMLLRFVSLVCVLFVSSLPAYCGSLWLPIKFKIMKIILGSQSKWRRSMLSAAGIVAEGMAADIDERAINPSSGDRATCDPTLLTVAIAKAKAEALLQRLPPGEDAILITADQVVWHEGRVREKPVSPAECHAYLQSYTRAPAQTVSSVVVTNARTRKQVHATDIAEQWFHAVPADVIDTVIAKGDIMECCGGFMIDEPLLAPYLGARTGTAESIMGLPVHLLPALIQAASEE